MTPDVEMYLASVDGDLGPSRDLSKASLDDVYRECYAARAWVERIGNELRAAREALTSTILSENSARQEAARAEAERDRLSREVEELRKANADYERELVAIREGFR